MPSLIRRLIEQITHWFGSGTVARSGGKLRQLETRNRELEQRLADLHQIEESLRTKHNLLQIAMKAGRMDTWTWDHHADVLMYPDTDMATAAGLPQSYANFLTRLLPEDREAIRASIARSFAENVPYTAEYRFPLPNGKTRWFYALGRVFFDDLGNPAGMTGVTLDIHRHKTAEETLLARESAAHDFQEQLKALHEVSVEVSQIDSLDDFYRRVVELGRERLGFDRLGLFLISDDPDKAVGTYGTDPQGNVRNEHKTWFTLNKSQLVQESISNRWNIILRDDTDLWNEMQVVGRGWNAMAMLWQASNPIGWMAADNLIRGEPLREEQLELLSLYASMIGALILKKQADLETRRHQERLHLALQVSGMRVWEWKVGSDQIIYDQDTLFGNKPLMPDWATAAKLIVPEDFERLRAEITRSADDDSPMYTEFRINHPDGTLHWVASLGQPYRNAEGIVEGIIGVSQDITERKQAEEQTVELASHKERVALLSEFMSNISHDLKTPLTVMNTSLYLLEKTDEPKKRAEKIEIIRTQAAVVENFIQDILTISRLDYTSALDMKPVDCHSLLLGVETRMRPSAEHKKLSFVFDVQTDRSIILGNIDELDRTVANLVENAIHYTPEGGEVKIRGYIHDDHLIIEVSDTGIGIQETDIPKIFTRFFRSENAREIYTGGTGLGLAIAKRIVEIHNGQIELESQSGRGTTFRLHLPISQTSDSVASLASESHT